VAPHQQEDRHLYRKETENHELGTDFLLNLKNTAIWDVSVILVRTDASEELSASIIRVEKIGARGTLAVTCNPCTLRYAHFVFLRGVHRLLVRLKLFLVHRFLSP
jgi:hypothetical protein